MKTKHIYPIQSLKIHDIDRKELAKVQAKALIKDRLAWLREEVTKLKKENKTQFITIEDLSAQLKNKEYRRAIVSSKHTAMKADVRKIIVKLKKTYQLNA